MSKFDIYNAGFKHISEIVQDNLKQIEDFKEGKVKYYPSKFKRLNRKLMGGFWPGKYIVIAARPGMGKSAFSNQLIFDILDNNKDKKVIILYWSFEMSGSDQISRLGAKKTKKELYTLFSLDGKLSDENFIEYTKVVSDYKNYPVYFSEKPTSSTYIYNVNKEVHFSKPDYQIFNIIDHSRFISKENENDELKMLNNLSKNLHLTNVEFKSINILLSQLNRDIEKDSRAKNQYKPLLSDLFGADSVKE